MIINNEEKKEKIEIEIIDKNDNIINIIDEDENIKKINEQQDDEIIIGIYIGPNFSCISGLINYNIEIIPNEIGDNITPSVLFIEDDKKNINRKRGIEKI